MADSEARLFDATGKNIGTYRLEVMDTFWKRFMGLMGRDDVPIGNAALFRKCSSIHMFFMKIPLDVIWYGASMPDGRVSVLSVARNVKPWQLSFGPKHTHGCLEVAAGTVPKNLDAIEIVTASYWASSYPWTSSEGSQYEAFKGKVTNNYSGNDCLKIGNYWWERSAHPNDSNYFLYVHSDGDPSDSYFATNSYCVCPAFSF